MSWGGGSGLEKKRAGFRVQGSDELTFFPAAQVQKPINFWKGPLGRVAPS